MKTVFLHVGMPKTGTTAVQFFCDDNKELLREEGLYYDSMPWKYPGVAARRNAHFLYAAVRDKEGKRDPEGEKKRLQEGYEIISGWLETCDRVLLTEEALWNRLYKTKFKELKALKAYLDQAGAVLKVVVYLRRQDEWFSSIYRQYLKGGAETRDIVEFWKADIVPMDYQFMIEGMAGIVGKENMIVRRYEKQRFFGGKVELDFLHTLGVSTEREYRFSEVWHNPSYCMNHLEIKRILNRMDEEKISHSKNSLLWEKALHKVREYHISEGETPMTKETADELMQTCEKGNQAIAREYFPGEETLFTGEGKVQKEWTPDDPRRYEDTVMFFAALALNEHEASVKQTKDLKEQSRKLKEQSRKLKEAEDRIRQLEKRLEKMEKQMENIKRPMKRIASKAKKVMKKS